MYVSPGFLPTQGGRRAVCLPRILLGAGLQLGLGSHAWVRAGQAANPAAGSAGPVCPPGFQSWALRHREPGLQGLRSVTGGSSSLTCQDTFPGPQRWERATGRGLARGTMGNRRPRPGQCVAGVHLARPPFLGLGRPLRGQCPWEMTASLYSPGCSKAREVSQQRPLGHPWASPAGSLRPLLSSYRDQHSAGCSGVMSPQLSETTPFKQMALLPTNKH